MSGITRPIGNVYFMGFFFFIFFVILAALGLLNLLTAIFIETLAALSSEHGLAQMKERKALKKKVKKFAEDTFRTYDTNKSGTLDIHELEAAVAAFHTAEYEELFSDLGMDLDSVKEAIAFADSNGDGEVDVQEFVRGISVMEEACTKRETWEIKNNNSRNFVHILHRIDDVEKSMAALHTVSS